MKPVEIERAVEKCSLVSEWRRTEVLKRWRWAIDGYIDGYIEHDILDAERAKFEAAAEQVLVLQAVREIWSRPPQPLTEQEEARRTEWLREQAEQAVRTELRQQRKRLREGAATLAAIRRHLRGVSPSASAV